MSEEPRVWIGCLGCYNAGTLTGEWFNAADCPEEMEEFNIAIGFEPAATPPAEEWEHGPDAFRPEGDSEEERVTRKGVPVSAEHGDPRFGPHEELWVMDHDNFRGLLTGECSPGEAKRIAEKLAEIGDNDAFDAWMTMHSLGEFADLDALIAEFDDAVYYQGESEQDAAYEYLESTCAFEGLPELWDNYRWHLAGIWADDREHGGEITFVHHNGLTWLFF